MLSGYADQLAEAGGRLYLSGVDPQLGELLKRTRIAGHEGDSMQIFEAPPVIGESSRLAYEAAEKWLEAQSEQDASS